MFINEYSKVMKKIALLVVSLVALTSVASAQGFGWGVKAGINVAGVSNAESGVGSMIGFTGGVFADYRFSDLVALSADLLYSAQGCRYNSDNKMTLSYLNIPILANFYVWGNLAVKAGLQPGFLLGSSGRLFGEKESGTDGLKSVDLTIPVGVSYEFPMGLILDARYGIGATNILDYKDAGTSRNGVFTITAGYRF